MNSVHNIFLTGATGVLGGRLLAEILLSTSADIYCLTRDKNPDAAKQRILALLRLFIPDHGGYAEFQSRIMIVSGDLTKPYLGLTPDIYKDLAGKLDLLIHSAASVNMLSAYESLKPVNVDGTARIVNFSLFGDIPVVYISTFAVLGDKVYEKDVVFYETELDVGQSFFYGELHYEKSKFEAEKIVRNAGENGLRWLIIRPGDIFGDSRTGAYPFDTTTVPGIFYDVFKAAIETGYSFFTEENFDVSPVDYVAKATLRLALSFTAFGNTFHLVNPDHKYFYEVINLLIEYGYRIRMIPPLELIKIIRENRMIRKGKPYSSIFMSLMAYADDSEAREVARYDTSLAQKFLENTEITCPKVDISLISTYLDYCIKTGYLPPPEKQIDLATIVTA